MHRKYWALLASIVMGTGILLLAAPASAKEKPVTVEHVVGCGYIDITFTNHTRWTFSADIRTLPAVGSEEAGTTDGDATTSGNQHRTVSVPPGTTTKRVTFPENSGSHPVQYRVRPRVQGDIFIDWVKHITVGTHCKPKHHPSKSPTASPTVSPTTSPTAVPTTPTSTGGALPVTGSGLTGLTLAGFGMVAAGALTLALLRRRRTAQ